MPLCSNCYANHYTSCCECGRIIHNEDARYECNDNEPLCHRCYDNNQGHDYIEDYYYKPEPIFYGKGNRFISVELEVDCGGEVDDNAAAVMRVGNSKGLEHIYCKHDGSLEEGFEIVTHPMTLNYHLNEMPWEKILTRLKNMSYLSHQADTCGLHIHVGRNAFGDSDEIQEAGIGRVVFFVEKHWNELVKFSRRSPSQLNRWAARYATISDTAKETYRKAKDKYAGRYVAVNLENYATIEFRMFRGTLRYKTFVATLQLVEEICQLAICCSDSDLEALSWSEFVRAIDREAKPELIEYLKSKRLYVNEAEPETEEDE
jgi:hypothetical protein